MHKLTSACLGALALSGCGPSWEGIISTRPPEVVAEVTDRMASRVLLQESCPVAGAPPVPRRAQSAPPPPGPAAVGLAAPLIGAAASLGADLAVRAVSDYFSRVSTELVGRFVATGAGALSADGAIIARPCIIVVRGRFAAGSVPQNAVRPTMNGRLGEAQRIDLGLVDYPDFYMEAWLVKVEGGEPNAIRVEPRVLQFAGTSAIRRGNGSKAIGMVLVLRTTPPAQASAPATGRSNATPQEAQVRDAASAVVAFDFGVMREGTVVGPGGAASPNPLADQNRVIRLTGGQGGGLPTGDLNLYAFVTEEAERGRVLSLIASTFDDNKSDLEKSLAAVIKSALEQATARQRAASP